MNMRNKFYIAIWLFFVLSILAFLFAGQPSAADVGLESVKQIGGNLNAIAVKGNYAYIGMDAELVILDISNSENLVLVSQITLDSLSDTIQDVMIEGNYAYVAAGDMYVIDISNPINPQKVGSYDTTEDARSVAIVGNLAYVAAKGLHIINISNPTTPTEVGYFDISQTVWDIAVVGNYAYVAAIDLRIIDISNPATPTQVGLYVGGGDATDYLTVAVAGNNAYFGNEIIDVSNPIAPIKIGSYDLGLQGHAEDIVVLGNYAYVTSLYSFTPEDYGLHIIDISNPTTPDEVGFLSTPGWASGVAVSGKYAYVADYKDSLRVIDISNSTSPIEIGIFETVSRAEGIAISGNNIFVADWKTGLHTFNMLDSTTPSEVSSYSTPGNAYDVAVTGNYAYIADGSHGLRIINVTDAANPFLVGFWFVPQGRAEFIRVIDDYAYVFVYVNSNDSFLYVVDISNPASPNEVGSYKVDNAAGGANGIDAIENYVYIALPSGLHIVDVSNPTAPSQATIYKPSGVIHNVAVINDLAYVAANDLHIINISNPNTPIEVESYDGMGHSMTVEGDNLFIASQEQLHIFNVNNPTIPLLVGSSERMGGVPAISGNYIYFAAGGLKIFRFVLPPIPITTTIPVSGGNLTSSMDSTAYIFPTNTFTDTVIITHTVLPFDADTTPLSNNLIGISRSFSTTATYDSGQSAHLVPGKFYTITIGYTDEEKGAAIENTLNLYWWDGHQWSQQGITDSVNVTNNTLVAQISHFSLFSVLGQTNQIYLPLIQRSH